ncbi:HET-domain-containing protein, partial [Zopfia rhizophila CBS 207.26]
MAKNPFKYPPLPLDIKTPIRLVVLLPQTHDTKIRCLLAIESLERTPRYEALSYVWGSPLDTREIEVNGKPFHVTSNLAAALHSLRSTHHRGEYIVSCPEDGIYGDNPRRKVLWIDALCIDQNNIPEKNKQVQQMSLIYSSAQTVICWLGPNTNNSERALDVINTWLRDWFLWNFKDLDALARFFEQEWFSRIWIVQEVVLAR